MENTVQEAVVRKSVRVQAPIERAFSVFIEQMETWWPPDHHIGAQPFESIFIEPHPGGRWYERDTHGNTCDWGTVLGWNPPHVVSLSWHLGPDWKFNPDVAKSSEVEIRFTAQGPSTTLVELQHSKFERHGEGYETLIVAMDGPTAWENTLTVFAQAIEGAATR